MTLNQKDTACLKTAIAIKDEFFYYLKNETAISNTDYEAIRAAFASWKVAYTANPSNLYGTNQNGSTYQLSGIDQFPIPPQR